MVVAQEMASIYPPEAEELGVYLPEIDCGACGFGTCVEFAEAVLSQKMPPHKCPELSADLASVMVSIVKLNKDPIPYNMMMEQTECRLIEIGSPGADDPLLITCNFRETVKIMQTILDQTATHAFLLPIFTHGYSVDNAVHERMFKAVDIWKAMQENEVVKKIPQSWLVIPGLAESQKNAIRQLTRWEVLVGPVSGFLLPLFILKSKMESLS
jgi:CO dehydrogenase/acetyl-CoA synthase gamma subunit (corrinoid Fe-S protein)